MHRIAIVAASLMLLAACNNKPAPAPQASANPGAQPAMSQPEAAAQTASSAEVEQKLRKVAGSDATDCGQVRSMAQEVVKKASDCAMESAKARKAFVVSYAMPGLTVGVAGNSEGKLFNVQSEVENGQQTEARVEPCASDLRVAQSGRVTCIKPGAVGTTPGTTSPHGAGPHGGMPPAGTPNPHQPGPKSSH
jgi:hypothetical protein